MVLGVVLFVLMHGESQPTLTLSEIGGMFCYCQVRGEVQAPMISTDSLERFTLVGKLVFLVTASLG